MDRFKESIIEKSVDIGFDLIGFAKAESLSEAYERYISWLDSGYNAKMDYMARNLEKRKNIECVLEEAKSVIVTATNYNTPFQHNRTEDLSKGKISRYAWGDDYHEVILPRLESLSAEIKKLFPDAISKCYVDTGPILEKVWAAKAGLGWQGKNSLILSKRFGSFIFLGLIITTAEFEADDVLKDYCGKCNACIESCPTKAIVEPKVVDSNKCISYWTIETKGKLDFPENISKNLNSWLFGCDICQDVCPWNRKKYITKDVCFYPRNNQTELDNDLLMKLDEDQFRVRFKNSPLKRSKLEGLKINMAQIRKKSGLKKPGF